jgi:hypothetical protein
VDVEGFVRDGYVVVRGAFDADTAAACRAGIWRALAAEGVTPDRGTWTRPCVRVECPEGGPFAEAGASPALAAAYDALIGPGRWVPRAGIGGSVPVRFPSEEYPGDVGYHIEGNVWRDGEYWTDLSSRGRGLLALFLFTDVGPADAPTRLVLGSHRYAAAVLARAGAAGLPGGEVAARLRPSVLCRTTVDAVGRAGDVVLCHPFMVHTATWPHRGAGPRMLAQPAVAGPDGFAVDGSDPSPVARAIVAGLADD